MANITWEKIFKDGGFSDDQARVMEEELKSLANSIDGFCIQSRNEINVATPHAETIGQKLMRKRADFLMPRLISQFINNILKLLCRKRHDNLFFLFL